MQARVLGGDCRQVLQTLEAGSADAVVTDPPYGQTNEDYDSPVAFDPAVWRACHRACKPNAALLAFAGNPTYHRIASAIEAAGWKVRQMWAWVYRDGLITSAYPREGFDRLAPAFDPIVFATKGKVLLNAARRGNAWAVRKRSHASPLSRRSSPILREAAEGHYPRCLVSDGLPPFEYFDCPRAGRKSDDPKTGHPNQKPLALMEWLVGKLPGGIILDPFMGSGTTGMAAVLAGFGFVGIECDPAYLSIARARLAHARRHAARPAA